jgi:hypothetical protein
MKGLSCSFACVCIWISEYFRVLTSFASLKQRDMVVRKHLLYFYSQVADPRFAWFFSTLYHWLVVIHLQGFLQRLVATLGFVPCAVGDNEISPIPCVLGRFFCCFLGRRLDQEGYCVI